MSTLHLVFIALGLAFTAIGAIWWLSSKISSVDTKVELLLTNHLPHMYEELKYLRERIDGR